MKYGVATTLLALLAFLQYTLWLAPGGLMALRELKQSNAYAEHINTKEMEQNAQLAAEVRDLKTGLQAIEERARKQMGMVKDGETFYQIIE